MTVTVASMSVLTKMPFNEPPYHNFHLRAFFEDAKGATVTVTLPNQKKYCIYLGYITLLLSHVSNKLLRLNLARTNICHLFVRVRKVSPENN